MHKTTHPKSFLSPLGVTAWRPHFWRWHKDGRSLCPWIISRSVPWSMWERNLFQVRDSELSISKISLSVWVNRSLALSATALVTGLDRQGTPISLQREGCRLLTHLPRARQCWHICSIASSLFTHQPHPPIQLRQSFSRTGSGFQPHSPPPGGSVQPGCRWQGARHPGWGAGDRGPTSVSSYCWQPSQLCIPTFSVLGFSPVGHTCMTSRRAKLAYMC